MWITPVSGASSGTAARTAASASRSAASQAARVTSAPSAVSSARRSSAPGASAPRRLSSSRCRAPAAASRRATWAPRAPVPPVIRTVPVGSHSAAPCPAGTGTSRRPRAAEGRIAIWSSPPGAVRVSAKRAAVRSSRVSGRSISPPQRCGYSRAATRPRPHTAAWVSPGTGSAGAAATAPRVTHHRGAAISASPSAWSRAVVRASPAGAVAVSGPGPSARASRETTPVNSRPSSTSWCSRAASATRSGPGTSRRTVFGPRAATASAAQASSDEPAGSTASQVPAGAGAGCAVSGCQPICCRHPSTVCSSSRRRRQSASAGSTLARASPSTLRVVSSAAKSASRTADQKPSSPSAGAPGSAADSVAGQYRWCWKG